MDLLTAQEHVQAAQVTGRGGCHGLLTTEEHVHAAQVTGRGGSHGLLTAEEHVQAAQVTWQRRSSWTYSPLRNMCRLLR